MAKLEHIVKLLGHPLPDSYKLFLAETHESFIAANDRTLVYGCDAIAERNETYESRVYCPGHVMIGDDSGGAAIILSLNDGKVHIVGMGSMTPDNFTPVAPSFAVWADVGFALAGD